MVRRNLTAVSDDRMRLGTGHGSEHWFELLDAAGAIRWRRSKIVDHLEEQGLRAWWANTIGTAYEVERGRRSMDGTMAATATRLLPTNAAEAWYFLADDAERAAWIGEDWPTMDVRDGRYVRLDCLDGTDVTLRLTEAEGAARVLAQHAKLTDEETQEQLERFWDDALDRLAEVLNWA